MADENDHPTGAESREPALTDLRDLCRELNHRRARYLVGGGFAMAALGYNRRTMEVDLLVDTAGENEARVLEAVATLPDGAARGLSPGEIARWKVVRVAYPCRSSEGRVRRAVSASSGAGAFSFR